MITIVIVKRFGVRFGSCLFQEVWKEKIRRAEARALEVEKEGKEAASSSTAELSKLKARLRAQARGFMSVTDLSLVRTRK